jgi:hypothetical protein
MTRKALTALAVTFAAGCATAAPTGTGSRARGTEAWSWRMNANEGRWNDGIKASEAEPAAEPEEKVAEPETPAVARPKTRADDPWAWRLGKTKVRAARKTASPKPERVASAPKKKPAPAELRTSPDDEEFLNKILDDNADAEDGEITMAAMELPKAEKASPAPKKAAAEPEMDFEPAKVAKKKRLTRAEKRRAKRLARLEARKAKQIAAREARLLGKRARLEREKPARVAKKKKPLPPEGFIDEEEDEEEDEVAEVDEDSGDDEEEVEEEDEPRPAKTKSKAIAAKAAKKPVKLASSGKSTAPRSRPRPVKTDWSGQAIDDEDPLKPKK